MTDNQPKWALTSKTIAGAVIALLVTLLPMFGLTFTADDAALFNTTVDQALQVAGSILAIYGRFTATQTLTVGKPE